MTLHFIALAVSAFLFGWSGAIATRWLAPHLRLVQTPNYRSSHTQPTPQGGGIAIALVAIGSALYASMLHGEWRAIAGITAAFALLGILDDVFDLSPVFRFPLQILFLALLLWWSMPILPMEGPFGLTVDGFLLLGLLLLGALWWVNLFNFMDGIDGIAASQAIIILLGSLAIALVGDQSFLDTPASMVGLATAAATGGFLVVNWAPARIFMGDAGSNTIAVLILVLALYTTQQGLIGYASWLVLIAPFAADATVALVRRTARGERPWKAHRRHAYQQLSRRWGHARVALLYAFVAAFVALPAAWIAQSNAPAAFWIAGAVYAVLITIAYLAGSGDASERT